MLPNSIIRIDIRDRIRRLVCDPNEDDEIELGKLRNNLALQINVLESHPDRPIDIPVNPQQKNNSEVLEQNFNLNNLDDFDLPDTPFDVEMDIAGQLSEDGPSAAADDNVFDINPELKVLPLPSNYPGSIEDYRMTEIDLRIKQASRALQVLRDLIAEKSFQYSHVIRVASRKDVGTRARASIKKLNHRIAYQCRVYGHCRQALIRLSASVPVLKKFRIIEKEDIRCSNAILNPNEPGSSRIRLSWIWQTSLSGLEGQSNTEAQRECKPMIK